MLPNMLIQRVWVLRGQRSVNRAGDEFIDWSLPPVRTANSGWVTWLRSSDDETLGGTRRGSIQVFFQPWVEVSATDRLEWNGRLFRVDGPPLDRYTVSGPHHREVRASLLEHTE